MRQLVANRNEVLQGPAPACLAVLRSFKPSHVSGYLEGYHRSLLASALAKKYHLPVGRVLVSYGLEDFWRSLCDGLNPRTDTILTHDPCFDQYKAYPRFKHIQLHLFRMHARGNEFTFDIEHCLQLYRRYHPKVVLITSPNNPTGNVLAYADFVRLLKAVSPRTLVVLDEAYAEFVPNYDRRFLGLLKRYPNLVIARTFSKFYALAGLRIGYLLCGGNVQKLLRYRSRNLGLSRVLEEVAIAALGSQPYYRKVVSDIAHTRDWLIGCLSTVPHVQPYRSVANFFYLHLGVQIAGPLVRALERDRVVIGKLYAPGYMRVTVSRRQDADKFYRTVQRVSARLATR